MNFLLPLALALVFLVATPVSAGYLPETLFTPQFLRLNNGMEVYLFPRDGVHSVSMRLAVGYGTLDEPCGRRELPHFLEHMLFTGTEAHSEEELDALISDNGGTWNAHTYDDSTVFEIDMFSANARTAFDVLNEILSTSTLSQEKHLLTQDIIDRENGGTPGALESWLYRRGIGMDAYDQAYELLAADGVCRSLSSAASVSLDEVRTAYHRWYVPGNMALFVAGDFAPEAIRGWLRETLGTLPAAPVPRAERPGAPRVDGPLVVHGTLAPILGTEAQVALAFRMPGADELTGAYDMLVYEQLSEVLFNEIRSKRGLAYSADLEHNANRGYGLLYVYADTDLGSMDEVISIMKEELRTLRRDGIDAARLETLKRRSLMKSAQYFASNASFTDYLAPNWGWMAHDGTVWNVEHSMESISVDGFNAYLRRYLDPERMVVVKYAPLLTYNELYTVALLLLLAVAGIAVWWALVWRRRRP